MPERNKTPQASLTTNGAALLGLLAIEPWPRPWTTYELAKQAKRSLSWFWPRAERQLYDTPKTLVTLGYARAAVHATGKRPSTLYSITAAGRKALTEWLDREGRAPLFEFEQLIRVFFAEHGSSEQLLHTLMRMERQSLDAQRELADIVNEIDDVTAGDRTAVNALSIQLVAELHRTTLAWTRWAQHTVASWDSPADNWHGASTVFDAVRADAK